MRAWTNILEQSIQKLGSVLDDEVTVGRELSG